eukprot:CAMPEP_0178391552 /NCGR_PEP_ID=MMETSP0689_2-20121128/11224_1 /TAXON_ID=160604 /ORGANISM="Amphidinium massartii, Strain CS-259" /LENGTH=317 /DNA_ID=CAMNT_0020012103 /DNA_START=168 /DNA_END=1121 /DNA_ORIENTATION=-
MEMLWMECPHRACRACVVAGELSACPVCTKKLPAEKRLDEEFIARLAQTRLRCDCGSQILAMEAELHECSATAAAAGCRAAAADPLGSASPGTQSSAEKSLRARATPVNRCTFTCPLCKMANLTTEALLEHCRKLHAADASGPVAAVCPICAAMPWGDPNYVSSDFLSHITLRHKCDYATLTDFEMDEEAILALVLQQSALESQAATVVADLAEEAQDFGGEDEDSIIARVLQESALQSHDVAPIEAGSNNCAASTLVEAGAPAAVMVALPEVAVEAAASEGRPNIAATLVDAAADAEGADGCDRDLVALEEGRRDS